tara:strand:- start:7206 stop:8462 length:1257 start_codon:yes stop_codon:yes gene_type:complete
MVHKIKQLLRFTTAGSVDDGKSTLIGRLLLDSKSIFSDQLQAIETISKNKGFDYTDLSLVTDGLKSEREQGITIDVAYRFFETSKRKFIIADTPGHIEYTRNMVTGASTANLAIILIDAKKGIVEQTKRHSLIASLLGIPHIIICVNKMDTIHYNRKKYEEIVQNYASFSSKLTVKDIRFIPISALHGDNIVKKSKTMKWYSGGTLIHELENIHISSDYNHVDGRFPIQYVVRPHKKGFENFRGYCGRIEGGIFKVGDKIKLLPSGFSSTITKINIGKKEIKQAFSPMSVSLCIEGDFDLSRGDMIVKSNNLPIISQEMDLLIIWLVEKPLICPKKLIIKHTTNESNAIVEKILYKIDINTLQKEQNITELNLNSIGRVKLRTASQFFTDSYTKNRQTGSIILIDPNSNLTVGAGLIK